MDSFAFGKTRIQNSSCRSGTVVVIRIDPKHFIALKLIKIDETIHIPQSGPGEVQMKGTHIGASELT